MNRPTAKLTLFSTALALAVIAPTTLSHFNDKEMPQSYRQSWFALVAANFGPMAAMVKGDMPYDAERMQASADDLATLLQLDIMRGFPEGSEKGTTRAKPGIWDNKADFEQKMLDLQAAANALQAVAGGEDQKQVAARVGDVGQTCKACHDDYKSKDYLY